MIVYTPVTRGKTKWLGPYHYKLEEMQDPVSKVNELIMLGAYLELEPEDEALALKVLHDLKGPFQREFGMVVDAYFQVKRILNEIAS
jgi:hypothetical protein